MASGRITLVVALLVGLLSACASSPDTRGPLPDGAALVGAAADTLRDLESVRFDFRVGGAIPGLSIRAVDGVATRTGGQYGWARGDADVQEHTDRRQYEYVLTGNRLDLTDSDGDRVSRGVPAQFSPARLLDPERGLRQLLTKATALETESREELQGVPAYRINGELSHAAVSALVPGIHDAVDVKFWVSENPRRDLLRLWVQVPPRQPNEGSVMLELALTDHNKPVQNAQG